MVITVVGLGLIGGSLSIALKERGFASRIIGVDNNCEHCKIALEKGIADELASLEEGIEKADLIILATPADIALVMLPRILDLCRSRVVTDVCSTKGSIASEVYSHQNRKQYVASHPMAGTEFSGPKSAFSGLFENKTTIICDKNLSGKQALKIVTNMYKTLNMKIVNMSAYEHDMHAAYVSHISHISSFVLSITVLEKEMDEKKIFELAGGGFESTVRLAKSSANMWVPIFCQNKENIRTVLKTYIEKLCEFDSLIAGGNYEQLHTLISEANKIEKILKK